MTEALLLKIVIGVFVSSAAALNVKIIWNSFNKPKENKVDIDKLGCDIKNIMPDIVKLTEKIEELSTKTENLSKVVMGNGDIRNSIAFKIASIEEFMKEMKKIKESRGL